MNLSDLPGTAVHTASRGGVHTVEWKEFGLKVTASKLREQSNGSLLADFDMKVQEDVNVVWLPIKDRKPDKKEEWKRIETTPPFKYFTRLNLKSAPTKASTAKDLTAVAPAIYGAEVDVWRYIVERVCNDVRVAFNKGEDGIELVDSKPESTEGGRRVSVLKRQEGAPVLLG